MSTVGTDITYTLPIPGGHVDHDYRGEPFTATEVEWHTYIYEGEAFELVRTSGTDATGCCPSNRPRNLKRDEVPEWIPRPPEPWFFLARAIAAQASEAAVES